MEFHHLGLAVSNINEALQDLKELFTVKEVSEEVYDDNQKVKLKLIEIGGFLIELIEGVGPDNPIKDMLKKRISFYHICFCTENIAEAIKMYIDKGGILVKKEAAPLFNNNTVAFLYLKHMGLIELLEK